LAVTWIGLAIAYFSPYPVGFWVTSLSFGLFVGVRLCRAAVRRHPVAVPLGEPA
jgi:zinc/manganese transport system permease protein